MRATPSFTAGRLDPGVELITKPFTQAALATKLRDILDAKRSPGRILLVEDEVLIQMVAAEYLEEASALPSTRQVPQQTP